MQAVYEREREHAAIAAALAGAAVGEGAIVFVCGHAGVGKSRLLRDARERAAGGVLQAVATTLERDHAFGVVRQLLVPAAAARPELLDRAAAGARALLLGGDADGQAGGEGRLFDLLHALYWAIIDLADPGSLLILVDDAHWADRPSLRFLLYLAQRIGELPVALAVAARPDEPEAHDDLLGHLRDHPAAVVLRPAPLTVAGVGAVVRERFPEAGAGFVSAARSATGGNPFLLRELLADLAARGSGPSDALAAALLDRPPEAIRRGALTRLGRLPDAAGALARAAAVLGEEATLTRCAALARITPAEAARLADTLAAVELLRPGEPPAFVHPLVGAAVLASMPAGERARLHGAAADLLSGAGAQAETIGAHLLRATRAGRAQAVEMLRRAAASALARGSPAAAVTYLRRALEEPPAAAARPALLVELAQAEALHGDATASERIEEALTLDSDSDSDSDRRVELLERLGAILQQRGDMTAAAEAFTRARDALSALPEDAARQARLEAAWLTVALVSPALAAEAHARVVPVLARAGRAFTDAERPLALLRAMQLVFGGEQRDHAVALALRAWNDGELLGDGTGDLAPVWQVAGTLAWSDALDQAERVADAGLQAAAHTGSALTRALACYSRAWPRYWRGDIAGAAADAQAAIDAWSGEFTMYLPVAAYWAAIAQLELGATETAAALVALPENDPRWAQTTMVGPLLAGRGLVALANGAADEAIALFERARAVALASLVTNPAVLPWRSYLSVALAGAGRRDEARKHALDEVALARRFGAARPLGIALRAAGLAHRDTDAVALLDEAVTTLRRSPARLELARALVDHGGALRRAGRRAAAREPLREGLALAQRFGATALEARAAEELEATGARPRRRALTGVASLTPSELRVAELAARGASNREIAQTLFVTIKAVRFHLGNIYRKLELTGRGQLTEALPADRTATVRPDRAWREGS